MTKEEQLDQTIEDFFSILSEFVDQFHKIFVKSKSINLDELASEDHIKTLKEFGKGEFYEKLNFSISLPYTFGDELLEKQKRLA